MIKRPEDVDKATLEEVLQWCKTHLPYCNDNDMNIWIKIVGISAKYDYESPMTRNELWEKCEEYHRDRINET